MYWLLGDVFTFPFVSICLWMNIVNVMHDSLYFQYSWKQKSDPTEIDTSPVRQRILSGIRMEIGSDFQICLSMSERWSINTNHDYNDDNYENDDGLTATADASRQGGRLRGKGAHRKAEKQAVSQGGKQASKGRPWESGHEGPDNKKLLLILFLLRLLLVRMVVVYIYTW